MWKQFGQVGSLVGSLAEQDGHCLGVDDRRRVWNPVAQYFHTSGCLQVRAASLRVRVISSVVVVELEGECVPGARDTFLTNHHHDLNATTMASSFHSLQIDPPTRLLPGSADDSVAARQNFIDRERASHDLLSFFPFRKKKATPLTRRHSPSRSYTPEDDRPHSPQDDEPLEHTDTDTSPAIVARDQGPNEVQLDDQHTGKSNKDTTLHRWAYVYENQRG